MNIRLPLAVSSLALALALGGCSASTEDATADDSASALANASTPITVANYRTHPKIIAIRDQVAAIEGLALTETVHASCDFGSRKFEDAQGRIRKLVSAGGEGGGGVETTTYYNEAGELVFGFRSTDTETEDGDETWWTLNELRVYYGPANMILFQVTRRASASRLDLIQLSAERDDRAPTPEEAWQDGGVLAIPAVAFLRTTCPVDPEEMR